MLTYIVIAIVAVTLVLRIGVSMQSSDFRVERKAIIPAPPAKVFEQVHDLHNWQAWSPWERIDPTMKRTYSGPASGPGASYAWVGDRNVGEGRMTIMESHPGELIRLKLEFFKPFRATNTAEFTFRPHGDHQTAVTWSMFGPKNFLAKALHLIFNMDKMIGGQFDQGLANMKELVKSANSNSTSLAQG